jgi:hypothetical protein
MQYISFAKIYRVLPRNHRVLPRNHPVLPSIFSSVDLVTEILPGIRLPFSQHWCGTYILRNLLELTYLQKDTYCSSSCPRGYYAKQTVIIGSATNATKERLLPVLYLQIWHLLRRKWQPMHRMQFRLSSVSYLNWRILGNLAQVVMDRGLREARLSC